MRLVEQHIIVKNHRFFEACDELSFSAKNLYNQGLYRVRQYFFESGKYLNYYQLQKQFQNEKQVDYLALPAKVSQQVLKLLDKNWKSFFAANKAYKTSPSRFTGRPQIPKYKDKTKGRSIVTYTIQAISKVALKLGIIKLSKANIRLKTKQVNIQQTRIIPKNGYYLIEVVYVKKEKEVVTNNGKYAAIDIGMNNLAAVAFNFKEQPIIINGKPLKSINQYYNKKKAKLQSYIGEKGTSNRILKLSYKRNNKVKNYLHNASRILVNQLVSIGVSKVIIGKNDNWKQEINIGKVSNENFVKIPHAVFISQLKYKLELEGIKVIIREESYTSKCSFFDKEAIQKHQKYLGRRIKRSWFKTSTGFMVHADYHGALNIGKKLPIAIGIPKAFIPEEIEAFVVPPVRITPHKICA